MNTNTTIASITFVLGLALTGCLESPLLNHADAGALPPAPVAAPQGCAFRLQRLDLCASLTWVKQPTNDEAGAFTFRFWSAVDGTEHGPYVDPIAAAPGSSVKVKLWMPSMGHGSSPVKVNAAVDAAGLPVVGVFEATEVFFVMGGAWEIWVEIKRGNQVVDRAKIDHEI
ncbi:MAG: hypothetical protein IT285_06465 [Bdellovibrionales bacterium]|nr:hypothetical protein [Bdellovibrionales bacterium]